MNFYQVGYYRKGLQGINSGWDLIAPSEGISQKATLGFQGYASNVIQEYTAKLYANPDKYPSNAVAISQFDNYVFLAHFNFRAVGEDSRGVTYAHAYCFTLKNYLELSKNPEKLFAITRGAFPTEYDDSIDEYPVVENVPHAEHLIVDEILKKYNISHDNYRKLLLGVIGAIEGVAEPVCIKKSGLEFDQYEDVYQDMMFIIAMGLPHFLRIKLTGFSAPFGGKFATVFLSDSVETGNYADLDTADFKLSTEIASKYRFTQLYTSPQFDVLLYDQIYTKHFYEYAIEELKTPLKDVDCNFIDHMFFAWRKNDQSEQAEIDSEMVCSLLPDFLSYDLNECDKVYAYLAMMLKTINDQNLQLADKKVVQNLLLRYENTTVSQPEFMHECERLLIRFSMDGYDDKVAFDRFYNIKERMPKLYGNAYSLLKAQDAEKAFRFKLAKADVASIISVRAVDRHLKSITEDKNQYGDIKDGYIRDVVNTIDILEKIVPGILANVRSNDEFKKTAGEIIDVVTYIHTSISEYDGSKTKALLVRLINEIWSSFDINWINVDDMEAYKNLHLGHTKNDLADAALLSKVDKITKLFRIFSEPFSQETVESVSELAFGNSYGLSAKKTNELLDVVCERFFESGDEIPSLLKGGAFDLLLAVSYTAGQNRFNIEGLGEFLGSCKKDNMFNNDNIYSAITGAKVLKKDDICDQLTDDLTEYIAANDTKDKYDKKYAIVKALKKYLAVLEGKELKDDEEIESTDSFLNTLYRGVIGVVAFSALGIFAFDIFKYFSLEGTLKTVLFSVAIALIVICPILSYMFAVEMFSDFYSSLTDYGLEDAAKLIIYLSVVVILGVALVLLFLLTDLWWTSIAVFVCTVIALILMVVRDFIVENR